MRILMVGLDAAGKTTILYKLKLGEGKYQTEDERASNIIPFVHFWCSSNNFNFSFLPTFD
jgi:GTPase SAR1 family protein